MVRDPEICVRCERWFFPPIDAPDEVVCRGCREKPVPTRVEFTHICIKNPAALELGRRVARVAETEADAWRIVWTIDPERNPMVKELFEGAIFTTIRSSIRSSKTVP